jgi:hypothetical protein
MTGTATLARPAPVLLGCGAGCGTPLHPAAAAGGHDRHPGCDPNPSDGPREYRWSCIGCAMTGHADNTDQAAAFLRFHERWACPATATSHDDTATLLQRRPDGTLALTVHAPRDDYQARLARRAALCAAYLSVPTYTRPWPGTTRTRR